MKMFMLLMLIKCIQYDFYNIICISNIFTWPYIHLDILNFIHSLVFSP